MNDKIEINPDNSAIWLEVKEVFTMNKTLNYKKNIN